MSSVAARIRSSAASTRLSSATSTGTTTSNSTALPIHHRFIGGPLSTRVGLVGKEEAAQHASEGHAQGPEADGETTGRRGLADLVGRQSLVDGVDAGLHVAGEVAH